MAVSERPILFSAPMVRAILDGRKTMTRRIVAVAKIGPSQWTHDCIGEIVHHKADGGYHASLRKYNVSSNRFCCPYGQPGDWLWVRESWRVSCHIDDWKPADVFKDALPADRLQMQYVADGHEPMSCCSEWGKLRPSIFMPRRASRITLEIVSVRVERLQEIREDDAYAEGVDWQPGRSAIVNHGCRSSVEAFENLWDKINAKRAPWASNPWVWVISFIKVAS